MKFWKGLSVLTIVGVVSGTLVQRDLQTIQNVLTTVSQQVSSLDSAVKSWNGGDTTPLTSASTQLLDTINSGVQTVSGTSTLSESDALGVASYVQGLSSSVSNAVNDFIAKHDALVQAGAGQTVEQNFQQQKTASQNLADAITQKVPQDLQSVATQLSSSIADSLQKGIDAFQGSGGSAPGSSASGSSSAAGPTSGSAGSTSGASSPSVTVVSPNGGNVTSPSAGSSPTQFTGAATKINGLEGAALALLAAVFGIFA